MNHPDLSPVQNAVNLHTMQELRHHDDEISILHARIDKYHQESIKMGREIYITILIVTVILIVCIVVM